MKSTVGTSCVVWHSCSALNASLFTAQITPMICERSERLVGTRHTFQDAAEEHATTVLYAPHPSSLRSRVSQERARDWYRRLAISIS